MITIDGSDLLKAETLLKNIPKGIEKAVKRSVNETAKGVKVDMSRAVTKNYNVTAAEVKRNISITKSPNSMQAVIKAKGRAIPYMAFDPKPGYVQHKGRRNQPVTIKLRKKGREVVEGGFIASMDTGHKGKFHIDLMRRLGKNRLPIKARYGPAIPDMVREGNENGELEEKAEERLAKSFAHNADRILKGYDR